MGQLKQKDFHAPMNSASIKTVRGRIDAFRSRQEAAADLTDIQCSDVKGQILSLTFAYCADAAAGESMSIDVHVNGATVLTAPHVVDDTYDSNFVVEVPVPNGTQLNVGDKLEIIRDYTAGGGATPMGANVVVVEVG